MNVFISWSGSRSQLVAAALHGWLPLLFQAINPWLSSADIEPGSRWIPKLVEMLDKADTAILVLTRDNLNAPWILFEAGFLARSVRTGKIVPYLFDVQPDNLPGPLSLFQVVTADEDGTRRLVKSLAENSPSNVRSESNLNEVFGLTWPSLQKRLIEIVRFPDDTTESHEDSSDSGSVKNGNNEVLNNVPNENQRLFKSLEGEYMHYTVDDEPRGNGTTTIEYPGADMILTNGHGRDGAWEGKIRMNDIVPEHGSGIYQYVGKKDCGVHEIQVNREDGSIYVKGTNTSHGKNYTFSYIWKRIK